jgi:hypothetical protein
MRARSLGPSFRLFGGAENDDEYAVLRAAVALEHVLNDGGNGFVRVDHGNVLVVGSIHE